MQKSTRRLIAICVVVIFSDGCLGPQTNLYPPLPNQPAKTIFVVNQGWHTGIVVMRSEVDTSLWREVNDFPDAEFIEVGWGDADFYQSEHSTLWLGLKALFIPTGSVLHVAGFNVPVKTYFKGYQTVKIRLSDSGFRRMCVFIRQCYERNKKGNVIPLGRGLYGNNSRFYRARGKYWFANTCNNWVAQALRAAGCPITPVYACTASNVFYQLKKFGEEYSADGAAEN